MLQERLYIPFKWALFLLFADVMCFFISVYLFNRSFWKVPKHTLFVSQKKREVGLSWVWYAILFFFSKAVVYCPHTIHFRSLVQEHRVSFINSWCHPLLLGVISFALSIILCLFGCHFDCHFGCHLFFF